MLHQDEAPDTIKEKERARNFNRLVYAAYQSTGVKYHKNQNELDHSGGRPVFYITVGQIKRTKITIKPDGDKVVSSDLLLISK